MLGQRISLETMDNGIGAIFMTNVSGANSNNKHRTTMVTKISFFINCMKDSFFPLSL